jgi:hypothetical protein
MMDDVFALLTSIVIVAGVTTLVLPGRQTVGVANAFWNGFSGSIRAATAQN